MNSSLDTSGTGNHFAEWGIVPLDRAYVWSGTRDYLALLSHSGSRGVGQDSSTRYSKLAREKHPDLDPSVKFLAWLSLDLEEGQEYWLSMELAGRFASANHYIIHQRTPQLVSRKLVWLRITTTSRGKKSWRTAELSSYTARAQHLPVLVYWQLSPDQWAMLVISCAARESLPPWSLLRTERADR